MLLVAFSYLNVSHLNEFQCTNPLHNSAEKEIHPYKVYVYIHYNDIEVKNIILASFSHQITLNLDIYVSYWEVEGHSDGGL